MAAPARAPIALFLCSYRRDLLRAERLLRSVQRHNVAPLPVCVAVPSADLDLFRERLPEVRATWVTQEEVLDLDPAIGRGRFAQLAGSVRQQVVKIEARRLQLADNLMVLDSDCVFLRDFDAGNLLDAQGVPWSPRNETLLPAADRFGLRRVRADWEGTMAPIREFFGTQRLQPVMHGPAPFLWSPLVWQEVQERWLRPRGWTSVDLIENLRSEFLIYGEAARALRCVPERPCGELFKCYHYIEQWWHDRLRGVTEADIARHHLGVVYQSNWQHELDFGSRKSLASRLSRWARRAVRWVRWRVGEMARPEPAP
jgi:hypothetical protein